MITDYEQVRERASVIRSNLGEAMGYAEKALKSPNPTMALDLPDELVMVLTRTRNLPERLLV